MTNNSKNKNDKKSVDNNSKKTKKEDGPRLQLIMDYSQQFPFLRPKKTWEK
jgi:hypothetical protein